MKIFLIFLNIALAAGTAWGLWGFFKHKEEVVYTVGRDRSLEKVELKTKIHTPVVAAMSSEDAKSAITRLNLFSISRCPDAVAGRGGRGGNTQMTLLGVYQVGPNRGAIIQQSRQSMPFQRNTSQNAAAVKTFYRVGESLDNGYTLTAISGNKVTLSRGSSTTELQLASAGATQTNTANQARQAQQQARRTPQDFQNMMMMGMMRQVMQNQQQQNRQMQQQQQQQQQNRQQTPAQNRAGTQQQQRR